MQDAVTEKVDNTEQHKQLVYAVLVKYGKNSVWDAVTLHLHLRHVMNLSDVVDGLHLLEKDGLIQSYLGSWKLLSPHDIVAAKQNKKR